MSQEKVARYRVPKTRSRSSRTFAERLALKLPASVGLYRSALSRLPLRSRLRRELVTRVICDSAAAYNRGDREAFFAVVDPDVEFNHFGEIGGLDRYHGRELLATFFATIDAAWDVNRLEPQAVIDFGDRYLTFSRIDAWETRSDICFQHPIGFFLTWSGRTVTRADFYWSRDKALEAAGLRE
jgi:ketosteroid isomerase-like protein